MTSFKLLLAAPIQFSFPPQGNPAQRKGTKTETDGKKKGGDSVLRDKEKIELIRQIETRSTLIVVIQTISERSKKKNINPKK